jgi:hypothetical protein
VPSTTPTMAIGATGHSAGTLISARAAAWDGPAILGVVASAAAVIGLVLLPWIQVSTLGSSKHVGLWSLLSSADTSDVGLLDWLAFAPSPILCLAGAGVALLFAFTAWRPVGPRDREQASAVGALLAGTWAIYVAWRTADAVNVVSSIAGPYVEISVGPGAICSVGGLFGAGIAALWASSLGEATPESR